ncbi:MULTISPECIES: hypothetical protein [unclassified Streptomyces]|uniref:hypothetical protein n=1 Tax=unclassified Streptomyces TaxID=2593676 RepID=UPI00224E41CB|nr:MULTISPECIES: hypothetical protein [unclassified Streptomyces]MCX4528194.1 hypothetical protein [Streptomyces sp. NBC_01551]MCX4541206.1 hypothetical protein [Streptomyces sp. NBC_01565]
MRVRTTAAALLGALAIVLPTAGPSLATDHDGRDGRTLGELHYRFVDENGYERQAQLQPADNDTCYRLTHTSESDPAYQVRNETRSLAILFDNATCSGREVETLAPGQRSRGNLEVASVLFVPTEDDEYHGRPDNQGGGNGNWQHDADEEEDLMRTVLRSIG